MAEYQPTRPQNVSGVDATRAQANAVDVVASARDIDVQLASARQMQAANEEKARSQVDYVAELQKLQQRSSEQAQAIKAKNDGTNAVVDPTLEKLRGELAQQATRIAEINNEKEATSGLNIFKHMALDMERNKLERGLAADSRSHNQLMDLKNSQTVAVNAELEQLHVSYNMQKEILGLAQGAREAQAAAVYDNAKISATTASYAAQTEMGVAANLYNRARQGLQDQQEAERMAMQRRGLELDEKKYKLESQKIDAQLQDVTTKYMLTSRGLSDNAQNRALVNQWLSVQDEASQRSVIDSSARWAMTMEHAEVSGSDSDPKTLAKVATVEDGTVADVDVFVRQTDSPQGLEAYLPSEEDVNTALSAVTAEMLAAKGTQMTVDAEGKQVPVVPTELSATEMKTARELAMKRLYGRSAKEQLASNKDRAERKLTDTFSRAPDMFINPTSVANNVPVMAEDPVFMQGLSDKQRKALSSASFQSSLRGQPTIITGALGEGTLDLANKMIWGLRGTNFDDKNATTPTGLDYYEAVDLTSKILTYTAKNNIKRVDPQLAGLHDSVKSATRGDFTYQLIIAPNVKEPGYFRGITNPGIEKFSKLKQIDISNPGDLARAVELHGKAKTEKMQTKPERSIPDTIGAMTLPGAAIMDATNATSKLFGKE